MTRSDPIFRMEDVSKRFGGMVALDNANLAIRAGSIHAVLGENGAGKSTLMKIMAGVIAPNEGRMLLDDREVRFASPTRATAAGVVCVFQELSLIPDLSVAENILIANPPRRLGMIDGRAQRRLAEEALELAGAPDIHPSMLVRDLPLSRKQMVEIAKALARRPRILILDEATSALDPDRRPHRLRRAEAIAGRGHVAPLHLSSHERDRGARRRSAPSSATAAASNRSQLARDRASRRSR